MRRLFHVRQQAPTFGMIGFMKGVRYLTQILVFLLGLGAAQAGFAADNAQSMPIAIPAPSKVIDQQEGAGDTYPVITARIVQMGGIAGNIAATRTVDGAVSRRTLAITTDDQPAQFDAALDKRLQEAGYDTLFHCQGAACGPQFLLASPGHRAAPDHFSGHRADQVYRAVRHHADDGSDQYVAYQIAPADSGAGLVLQFDQALSIPREVGAIAVNADAMAQQLDQTGRVALYGIFFDTDSDRLKPGGNKTVHQIAQLLGNRPELKLLVVGHTDSQGSFDYNQALSLRRARAVVTALRSTEDIARDRLKALGVGYAAPRASNASDVGRARNRRVELVPW